MDSDAEATRAIWDCGRETWSESGWLVKIADLVCRKMVFRTPIEEEITDEHQLRMVESVRNRPNDELLNKMRAMVFRKYWERIYKLKRSGFSGTIAIMNRDYILTDAWLQSLFGIFVRKNTVIERQEEL